MRTRQPRRRSPIIIAVASAGTEQQGTLDPASAPERIRRIIGGLGSDVTRNFGKTRISINTLRRSSLADRVTTERAHAEIKLSGESTSVTRGGSRVEIPPSGNTEIVGGQGQGLMLANYTRF